MFFFPGKSHVDETYTFYLYCILMYLCTLNTRELSFFFKILYSTITWRLQRSDGASSECRELQEVSEYELLIAWKLSEMSTSSTSSFISKLCQLKVAGNYSVRDNDMKRRKDKARSRTWCCAAVQPLPRVAWIPRHLLRNLQAERSITPTVRCLTMSHFCTEYHAVS